MSGNQCSFSIDIVIVIVFKNAFYKASQLRAAETGTFIKKLLDVFSKHM